MPECARAIRDDDLYRNQGRFGSGGKTMTMVSQAETFNVDDLHALSDQIAAVWRSVAHRDWSVAAGTLDWTCLQTADHAVDCVYAPAFFLASRRTDGYPEVGLDLTLGSRANPVLLAESLEIATRLLAGIVNNTDPDVRAVIFRRPEIIVAPPADFVPRAATELILHAHDVCRGLGGAFEPPSALCHRLREHTRSWPMWTNAQWSPLGDTSDPWNDLLKAAGRGRDM